MENRYISEVYYNEIGDFAENLLSLIEQLKNNPAYDYEEIINAVTIEILNCFRITADLSDLDNKEGQAVVYIHSRLTGATFEGYIDFINRYEFLLSMFYNTTKFDSLRQNINEIGQYGDFSTLCAFFPLDPDFRKKYLNVLYRFASMVIKADGVVTKDEEENLKRILNFSNYAYQSINNEEESPVIENNYIAQDQTLEEALEELELLVGLNKVKEEINTLINFIKIQKAREEAGLKSSTTSYHIVFTGNPGTGKTTVARIIAKIFRHLGILEGGHLVETDRSGMIAEYTGQTAVKVNNKVDSAINGVLFIDEAYSLVGENQDDFGKEAVSTLIKRMEDDRNRLIVVLAGYTDEMQKFIDTNPGFKSRFNRYLDFSDYTPEELLKIFHKLCDKFEYKFTNEANDKLIHLFSEAYQNRDNSFGNGRLVRNVFEKAIERQSNRISGIPKLTKEILVTIIAEDIVY